jgi:hypothetical protein
MTFHRKPCCVELRGIAAKRCYREVGQTNGVRTIIVETANRFARDLMVQEVGFAMLRDLGITLPYFQVNPPDTRGGLGVR